jgi:hypothetical protein
LMANFTRPIHNTRGMHTALDAPLHSRIGPFSQRVFDPIDLSPAAYRCRHTKCI